MEIPTENTGQKQPDPSKETTLFSMLYYRELMQQVIYGSDALAERVYDIVMGLIDHKDYPIPQVEFVENAFADGEPCERLYEQMHDAAARVYKRLGMEKDRDVEDIIYRWMDMMHIVSIKMFEYGMKFAQEQNKSAQ
ncbi:MAG: hypothetical protein Q4P20_00330 [Eubacteriales bacterium]|nr:hypothetical protein [Eubacteriales bacterium]